MKKKVLILALTALLIIGTISIAFSRGYARRGKGLNSGLCCWAGTVSLEKAGLNLSQEQIEKLQPFQIDFDKQALPLQNEIELKTLELKQLWLANELDEDAIVAKSKQVSVLRTQLQEYMIRHRIGVAKILTPGQRTRSATSGYWAHQCANCCGYGYQSGGYYSTPNRNSGRGCCR